MKLIVDIDDELVETAKFAVQLDMGDDYVKSIANGTPLPKGHGRLIDADKLTENILCQTFGLRSVDIDNAPTIIEADKTESEEKSNCSTCANANNVIVCPYTIKDIAAEEGCKFWHESESER